MTAPTEATVHVHELEELLEQEVPCEWRRGCDGEATHALRYTCPLCGVCSDLLCTRHALYAAAWLTGSVRVKHVDCGTDGITDARVVPL